MAQTCIYLQLGKEGDKFLIYIQLTKDVLMTIQELILYGIKQLPHATTPRLDVEMLLVHILHCSQAILRSHPEREIPNSIFVEFKNLLIRRSTGEPVAYIVGEKHFWNFSVEVSKHVLVPRPDTEVLVEQALAKIKQNNNSEIQILDLGTGSGIVAIALALEIPNACIHAVDCSLVALNVAKVNATKNSVSNIFFYHGNWFDPLTQKQKQFHLIVSNPPYIAKDDPYLLGNELGFEPEEALVSGPLGLDALTTIVSHGYSFLMHGGWLLVEHGYNQVTQVTELFRNYNYSSISSHKDLQGHFRVTCGCKL